MLLMAAVTAEVRDSARGQQQRHQACFWMQVVFYPVYHAALWADDQRLSSGQVRGLALTRGEHQLCTLRVLAGPMRACFE